MNETWWHYHTAGRTHGPVSFETLRQRARDGRLSPSDRCWEADEPMKWHQAGALGRVYGPQMALPFPPATKHPPPTPVESSQPGQQVVRFRPSHHGEPPALVRTGIPLARPLGSTGPQLLSTGLTSLPSIAIVGTEGSGKTVLLTVMAKRFSRVEGGEWFMNPLSGKTARYVERNWATLVEGEWPTSTTPGEMVDLHWRLRVRQGVDCDLRLIDVAGQDLRRLFAAEDIQRMGDLPEMLQTLANYVRSADILLFLVNLKDFVGVKDSDHQTANQWAIKYAMDYLASGDQVRRFCLVFTQVDQYLDLMREHGGWREVAKKYLPYLYQAHLSDGTVPIIPVTAVSKTVVVMDDDGTPRRIPDRDFKCAGLNALIDWISASVEYIAVQRRESDVEQRVQSIAIRRPTVGAWPRMFDLVKEMRGLVGSLKMRAVQRLESLAGQPGVVESGWRRLRRLRYFRIALWSTVCLIGSCVAWRLIPASPPPVKPPQVAPRVLPPTRPVATIVERWFRPVIEFDDYVEAYGQIRNDGAAGKILVTAVAVENEMEIGRETQAFFLNPGESANYSMKFYGAYDLANRKDQVRVTTDAVAP